LLIRQSWANIYCVIWGLLQLGGSFKGEILTDKKAPVTYEVTYIIKPTLDEEAADRIVAAAEEYIKGQGGTIQATDKKGRRRLTYEVKKMKDGYYVSTIFTIDTQAVANIKRMMNLSEDILRSLIVIYVPEDVVPVTSGYR
jgi:small subunit ribosomal protein S6